jgi:protein tyrosine/serine phosphatase
MPPKTPQADASASSHSPGTKKRPARRRILLILSVTFVVLIGTVIWWYAGLRNYFVPDNFGVVEPGKTYRSAQIHQRILRQTLLDNNIKVIVDLSQEDSEDAEAEKRIAAELGVKRIAIPGLSGKGIGDPNAYPEAIEQIVAANRAGKAVLVHCQSGAQRTGGVIATYRMLIGGKSEADVFA